MEEKINFLKSKGVEIDAKIDDSEWIVCYDNVSDVGGIGCYPTEDEFDTFEEAIEFAYNCVLNEIGVSWINQYPI